MIYTRNWLSHFFLVFDGWRISQQQQQQKQAANKKEAHKEYIGRKIEKARNWKMWKLCVAL